MALNPTHNIQKLSIYEMNQRINDLRGLIIIVPIYDNNMKNTK
jgi:patatin-like phospholipase/acyl hydrolase